MTKPIHGAQLYDEIYELLFVEAKVTPVRLKHFRIILKEAHILLCAQKTHSEYDRGICELIARLLPGKISTDRKAELVAKVLGVEL